ncbi:MAG: Stp1/IreP family PP2C-type Ser/Thr phosphatase [Tissierellia bacterium]|nr:Stp1/IreP family PP2C-type Ser/Thr phosphatase [Tissierellia bacterium]
MQYFARSDIGKVRAINEDSVLALTREGYHLFIVCDGLGGHLSGEVASSLAIQTIADFIDTHYGEGEFADCKRLIEESLQAANRKIYHESLSDQQLSNMGTTAEVSLVVDEDLYIGHVGDSRVYLHREGALTQLTIDHSLINDLIASGSVTPEDAKNMGQRNIITRALGVESGLLVDLHTMTLKSGDILMMCSDGLTNGVEDDKIHEVLELPIEPEEKVDMLIYMANASGGYDNSTIILAEMR